MTPKTLDLADAERLGPFGERSRGTGAPSNIDLFEAERPPKASSVSNRVATPESFDDEPGKSATDSERHQFVLVEGDVASKASTKSLFRASLEALSDLRSRERSADWLELAGVLKHDAVRLRNTSHSRHAAVLLAIADALTFTEPDDPTLDDDAATAFSDGLALLSEPFIKESDEEAFLVELIVKGWNLAPAVVSQAAV